jgi:hypothetical protein
MPYESITELRKKMDEEWFAKLHAYVPPPFVPSTYEDETPDNDNPFQGREDDERVTSQLD